MTRGIIAIDFDGTCVDHRYPHTGQDVPDAAAVIREIQARHEIILLTMRGRTERDPATGLFVLDVAVRWFRDRELRLHGVNENPGQEAWTDSRKVYANRYIDDAAVGCPLTQYTGFRGPVVHWLEVRRLLTAEGLL